MADRGPIVTPSGNQRWRAGRDLYRPAGEVIDPRAFDVGPLGELDAKSFVLAHHYSRTYPAARHRFGLFARGGWLVGVAVLSQPCSDHVLGNVFPWAEPGETCELGRFVLLDEVPGNGETWFLGRVFAELRRAGLGGVLSFSDPVARRSAAGDMVFPGHLGTIYQAHNARYLGRGTARTLRLLPGGQVLSPRAHQKVRAGERGWRYAAAQLVAAGAPAPRCLEAATPDLTELRTWLGEAVERTTRALRHPGNHRYAWGLNRTATRLLAAGGPYPKNLEAA